MKQEKQVEILNELIRQVDQGENIDAGAQYKMPMSAYVCPEIAAKEWDLLFQNHPQLIGLSGDLPEPCSFLTFDDFGTPVLATRDREGVFHAFLNACRHRGVRVAQDVRGKKNIFSCPFHAWSYANTGELIAISDEAHFGSLDKSCHGLIELPAVERDGLLWVHPQPDGRLDIDDLLGGVLADELASYNFGNLTHAGVKTIDMNLNWKLANDTFGETYHFGKLHKNTLAKIIPGNTLHLEEFGPHHRFVTAAARILDYKAVPESQWDIHVGAGFILYYLFPNITLIAGKNNCTLVKMYPDPLDAGRSKSQVFAYYSQELIDIERAALDNGVLPEVNAQTVYDAQNRSIPTLAATMEIFTSTIENEDYQMGEWQQITARNGLLKSVVFGRNELPLHHFHKTFRDVLELSPLEKLP